jgi:hypothetical protein
VREAEEAAAAAEHAEREEMARLGEEEGEELAREAEAAGARRLAVESRAADQPQRRERWGARAPRLGCGGAADDEGRGDGLRGGIRGTEEAEVVDGGERVRGERRREGGGRHHGDEMRRGGSGGTTG